MAARTVFTVLGVIAGIVLLVAMGAWAMGTGARPVVVVPSAPAAGGGPTPTDEAGLRALLRRPDVVARGKTIYGGLCFTCHGAAGEGGLGPNLRDEYWINGSDLTQLVALISEGKSGTAMQPMRYTYDAADIAAVAVYVATLTGGRGGTDKAPEGTRQPITYLP